MELYRRARGALPFVFTFIRTVDQLSTLNHALNVICIKKNFANLNKFACIRIPPMNMNMDNAL